MSPHNHAGAAAARAAAACGAGTAASVCGSVPVCLWRPRAAACLPAARDARMAGLAAAGTDHEGAAAPARPEAEYGPAGRSECLNESVTVVQAVVVECGPARCPQGGVSDCQWQCHSSGLREPGLITLTCSMTDITYLLL
jgi:hypothetical protein